MNKNDFKNWNKVFWIECWNHMVWFCENISAKNFVNRYNGKITRFYSWKFSRIEPQKVQIIFGKKILSFEWPDHPTDDIWHPYQAIPSMLNIIAQHKLKRSRFSFDLLLRMAITGKLMSKYKQFGTSKIPKSTKDTQLNFLIVFYNSTGWKTLSTMNANRIKVLLKNFKGRCSFFILYG